MEGEEILISLLVIFGGLFALAVPISKAVQAKIRENGHAQARKMFERITMAKLKVVSEAIMMGYKEDDLKSLDSRLGALIGPDEMKRLLDDTASGANQPAAQTFMDSISRGGSGKQPLSSGDLEADQTVKLAEREQQ
jgi:hypothetical protein